MSEPERTQAPRSAAPYLLAAIIALAAGVAALLVAIVLVKGAL